MGIYSDCKTAIKDEPTDNNALSALQREVLYARIRAFSVRVQYMVWNVAGTVLLYVFPDSLLQNYEIHYLFAFHFIQLSSILFYFLTSLCNPGYVPFTYEFYGDDSNENEPLNGINNNDNNNNNIPNNSNNVNINMELMDYSAVNEWNKDICIDPQNAPFNFCWRCKFIRPVRSKHCYDCDRCISKFDHHCPMVGNCVGGKNHRWFVLFLLTEAITVVWVFQLCLTDVWNNYFWTLTNHDAYGNRIGHEERHNAIDLNFAFIFRMIFLIFIFFALLIVIGLCGFHVYLSSTGQTTYEMIKPHLVEKWVKQENKRKRKWKKHQYAHINESGGLSAFDENDNTDSSAVDDTDYEDDGFGRRIKRHDEYISFNRGFCLNYFDFFRGKLKKEWVNPLPCKMDETDASVVSE